MPTKVLAPDGDVIANLHELAARPGEWGRVAVFGRSRAYVIRDDLRKLADLPRCDEGEWQFEVMRLTPKQFGIWARFLPTTSIVTSPASPT